MGYRSDVKLIIESEKLEHLFNVQDYLNLSECPFEMEYAKSNVGNGYLGYINSYCKYYFDYQSVKRVEEILGKLELANMEDCFLFLRVGESYEDYTDRGLLRINMFIEEYFDEENYEDSLSYVEDESSLDKNDFMYNVIVDEFTNKFEWFSREEAEKIWQNK